MQFENQLTANLLGELNDYSTHINLTPRVADTSGSITATEPNGSNDTIATAIDTGLSTTNPGRETFTGTIGDNPALVDISKDVDFYSFQLEADDIVRVDNSSFPNFDLQIFDANGNQIETFDGDINYKAISSGIYYLGVSGEDNLDYNPNVVESGTSPNRTGNYSIEIFVEGLATEPNGLNDTIATAIETGLSTANPGRETFTGTIGDNPALVETGKDVDFYSFQLEADDIVRVDNWKFS